MTGICGAFRGISGEYEVQRMLGAAGTMVYTLAVPSFVAAGVMRDVSVTEFCLAFPAGLAACIGASAGAIALKDRNVAKAKRESMTNTESN